MSDKFENLIMTKSNDKNQDVQKGVSSVGYQASNSLSANASKTLATLGEGNVTIKDIENSDELDRLNRDTTAINKDLYSSKTGTSVDATLDTRLLTEDGRNQIAEEFNTAKKDWYAIYKVLDAYISDESKNILKNILVDSNLSIEQQKELFVENINNLKDSALQQGYDVDKMTKEEKIALLEKFQSSDKALTTEQKELRDAIWLSEIPLSDNWNKMRDTHIEDIAKSSVKSKDFWITEQKWNEMSNEDREKFLTTYNDKNNLIIGNTIITGLKIKSIEGEGNTLGTYNYSTNNIIINLDRLDGFYPIINTVVHEGSGHGYQDYILENKEDYLKNNPKQKDDIRILNLSFYGKSVPNSGLSEDIKSYDVYYKDPAEVDAFRMGNIVEDKVKRNKNEIKTLFKK